MPGPKGMRGDIYSYSISDNQAGIKTQSRTFSTLPGSFETAKMY
jgi:hypothetical protein